MNILNDTPQASFPGLDAAHTAAWLICSRDDRWPRAVRRFAPELTPGIGSMKMLVCEPADSASILFAQSSAIVLWQIETETLGAWCDRIAKTSIASPNVLQLAATSELSPLEQAALSELGVAAMIRHIEQLPMLAKMIRRYLAAA